MELILITMNKETIKFTPRKFIKLNNNDMYIKYFKQFIKQEFLYNFINEFSIILNNINYNNSININIPLYIINYFIADTRISFLKDNKITEFNFEQYGYVTWCIYLNEKIDRYNFYSLLLNNYNYIFFKPYSNTIMNEIKKSINDIIIYKDLNDLKITNLELSLNHFNNTFLKLHVKNTINCKIFYVNDILFDEITDLFTDYINASYFCNFINKINNI